MHIELVTHNPRQAISGIGRYVRELHRSLAPLVPVEFHNTMPMPLVGRLSMLQHFPLGVQDHQPGHIAHFTQIMGCAVQLWRSYRPSVATVHDLGVLVCKEDEVMFKRVDRVVLDAQYAGLRKMQQYAVNSMQTKRHLVERLGIDEARIHHVQLGVELDTFRPMPNAEEEIARRYNLRRDPATFYLIYVGSELPRKNVGVILKAMAALKSRGYRVHLIKIGSPGGERWRAHFKAEIDGLGLVNEVIFPGVVPDADLPLFYTMADLAVTGTLLEGGFAWVAMEAMGCGRPVVASQGALLPDEMGEAALIVANHSADEMAAAIARLIDDSALRTQMAAAGQRLIKRYTWEATAQQMLNVYANIG
jgi:glycosyltransferase involved in cell wall biosynthesis